MMENKIIPSSPSSSSSSSYDGKLASSESQNGLTDLEAMDLLTRRARDLRLPVDVCTHKNPYSCDPSLLPLRCSMSDGAMKGIGYFITYSWKISGEGNPVRRHTLGGYWLESGEEVPILHNDTVVGFRKDFVFHHISKPEHSQASSSSSSAVAKGKWCAREYRLNAKSSQRDQFSEVICFRMERVVLIRILTESGSDQ